MLHSSMLLLHGFGCHHEHEASRGCPPCNVSFPLIILRRLFQRGVYEDCPILRNLTIASECVLELVSSLPSQTLGSGLSQHPKPYDCKEDCRHCPRTAAAGACPTKGLE